MVRERFLLTHSIKLNLKESADSLVSEHSKEREEVLVVEDLKELLNRSLLQSPLGIQFSPLASINRCISSYDSGGLLESNARRERRLLIAAEQSLEGASIECANMLNNWLDAYIKRLIKYCIGFVGARCGYDLSKNSIYKQQFNGKLVNGILPGLQFQSQCTNRPLEGIQEWGQHLQVSLLDFKVAMEINPQQLGADWPLLLEEICACAFDEWYFCSIPFSHK